MVNIAIDIETGAEVPAKDAHFEREYACKHCRTPLHPVLRVPNPFYKCYEGGKHTNIICKQLVDYERAYDIKETDIDKLFAGLFSPDKEPTTPPPPPPPPPGPGGPGDGGGGGSSGKGEPPQNKVLPCRRLNHLWQTGIYNLPSYAKIGDAELSDIFLWFKDFNLLKTAEPLGNRILAVRPVKPLSDANAILFKIFRKPRGESYSEEKYFILKMDNRKQFNQACNRLFDLKENAGGVTEPVPKRTIVVIAGDWSEIDHADYTTYEIDDGPHRFGAQIAHYYSSKQIYANPAGPFKTK